jgi:hypothetical protein
MEKGIKKKGKAMRRIIDDDADADADEKTRSKKFGSG